MKLILGICLFYLLYQVCGRYLLPKYAMWKTKKDKQQFLKENPHLDEEKLEKGVKIPRSDRFHRIK